jgi:hypothetical protein
MTNASVNVRLSRDIRIGVMESELMWQSSLVGGWSGTLMKISFLTQQKFKPRGSKEELCVGVAG